MEEQGKRKRVMDNGDSHIAVHIPHIKTIHTTIHNSHSHAFKSNPFEWYKFKFILRYEAKLYF